MSYMSTKTRRMRRAAFNLSYEKKFSMKFAQLTPAYLQEIIPGDSFRGESEVFMRMAPMLAPIMHRVNVSMHYFYVPNRIIWDGWQDFITGGEDGLNDSSIPTLSITTGDEDFVAKKSLYDHFGLPVLDLVQGTFEINALPFRAYQTIYNEYFRDQNLQSKITVPTGDSGDTLANLMTMRTRCWEKDYFTSCLPNAQKGAPIHAPVQFQYNEPAIFRRNSGEAADEDGVLSVAGSLGGAVFSDTAGGSQDGYIDSLDPDTTGIDVEQLREAVRLQEWLEKNMRAGSRYVESIKAHFDERVPDYTAQRPVYLGGGKQPVTISEVLQSSTTGFTDGSQSETPQGNMAGHGISVGKTNRYKAKFTEHGFVIGMLSVLPRTAYQQGMDRMWSYRDKFDLYWPEFAQLGEQEVSDKEIYFNPIDVHGTFGYQSRYAHMKHAHSKVAGDFRDNLAFWHMGRIFNERPALNSQFVQADPRTDIFAVTEQTNDPLYVQVYNNIKAVRPIPKHNVPTL